MWCCLISRRICACDGSSIRGVFGGAMARGRDGAGEPADRPTVTNDATTVPRRSSPTCGAGTVATQRTRRGVVGHRVASLVILASPPDQMHCGGGAVAGRLNDACIAVSGMHAQNQALLSVSRRWRLARRGSLEPLVVGVGRSC